ncbi:MAG: hypothetical protein ACYC1I_13130, partial [Acidimicrobiales bacterium]
VQATTGGMTAAGSTSQSMSYQFTADVQGATSMSENAAAVACGGGTLVLGLAEATGTVAYAEQTVGATSALARTVCPTSGVGGVTVAQNVTAVSAPVVTGAVSPSELQAGWVNANQVGYVTIGLTVIDSHEIVLLTGAPEAGGAL